MGIPLSASLPLAPPLLSSQIRNQINPQVDKVATLLANELRLKNEEECEALEKMYAIAKG